MGEEREKGIGCVEVGNAVLRLGPEAQMARGRGRGLANGGQLIVECELLDQIWHALGRVEGAEGNCGLRGQEMDVKIGKMRQKAT
jgi:hypothetical protein